MDFFNKKKLAELTELNSGLLKDNQTLLARVDELKKMIENHGYQIPKVKHMIFRNDSHWLVQSHFNTVINAMNAHDIEIVDFDIEDYGFDIYYRLPPNLKSVNFSFGCDLKTGTGTSSYEAKFEFVENNNENQN